MQQSANFTALLFVSCCFLANLLLTEAVKGIFIDFGGQFIKCFVSFNASKSETLINLASERATLSSLCIKDSQRFFDSTYNICISQDPKLAIPYITRLLGKTFDDPYVKWYQENFPSVPLRKHLDRNTVAVQLEESVVLSIEEVLSLLVVYLKDSAFAQERQIFPNLSADKQKIDYCAISLPSFFTFVERQAIVDALKLVGIDVSNIYVDLDAAAIEYYLYASDKVNERVLFFDAGATKSTASLVDITADGNITVVQREFNSDVGGLNVSLHLLNEIIIPKIKEKDSSQGVLESLEKDHVKQLLLTEADKMKTHLRSNKLIKKFDVGTNTFFIEVSQDELNEKCEAIMEKMLSPVKKIISDPEIYKSIKKVIPIGNSTLLRYLENFLTKTFNGMYSPVVNLSETISKGTMLSACITKNFFKIAVPVRCLTHFPHQISIRLSDGKELHPISKKNSEKTQYTFQLDHLVQDEFSFYIGDEKFYVLRIKNLPSFSESKISNASTSIIASVGPDWRFSFSSLIEYQELVEPKNNPISEEKVSQENNSQQEPTSAASTDQHDIKENAEKSSTEPLSENAELISEAILDKVEQKSNQVSETNEATEPKYLKRKDFYVVKFISTIHNPLNMSSDELKLAKKRVEQIIQEEIKVHLLAEKKNSFESLFYSSSTKLSDEDFVTVLTEKEAEHLKGTLVKFQSFLDIPVKEQSIEFFGQKINELSEVFHPFTVRFDHFTSRTELIPYVREQLDKDLNEIVKLSNLPEVERNSLTQEEIEHLSKVCLQFNSDFSEIERKHANLPPSTDPFFDCNEISDRINMISKMLQTSLLKKATPLPKPVEEKASTIEKEPVPADDKTTPEESFIDESKMDL